MGRLKGLYMLDRSWLLSAMAAVLIVALISVAAPGAREALAAGTEGMAKIPAGKFLFGDEDEAELEKIDLKEYHIDKYEVTNAEFRKFKAAHKFPSSKADHPVVNVTWDEAKAYCESMGKRLPAEEEWAKAARGTDGREYPWGEDFDSARVNSREANIGDTTPVGKYEGGKSVFGAFDMSGNVREWVDAWFDLDNKVYRVVRGGAYLDDEEGVYAFLVRKSIPGDSKAYIGFRCAK